MPLPEGPRTKKLRIGNNNREEIKRLANDFFDETGNILPSAYTKFEVFIQAAKAIDPEFRCYGDALDFIIDERGKEKRRLLIDRNYSDKILDSMLTVRLYPYQKEGIRFAVKAGKAIIADEMGLGKTIQAIASAELFLREGMAESVLIVCPTSLKYQWKKEIERFTGGERVEDVEEYIEDGRLCPKVIVVEGNPVKRSISFFH